MPVTVQAHSQLTDDQVRNQIERIYETSPEFSDGEHALQELDTALGRGDVLYTADFNDKVIAAIWSRGTGDERLLQYVVVHPANRGRGIAEQLLEAVCVAEAEKGVKHFRPGCGAVHRMLAHLNRLG
jgi:GNAT superfamily N-acetyltransferase